MKKGFLLVFILAISLVYGIAQTRVIGGTVISSEDGLPIPGVSVQAKETSIGTITNKDGVFSITVPQASKTLIFSFVGMSTQEIEITSEAYLKVQMVATTFEVDEVVVTALGISKEKKSLTYSATEVKSNEIVRANESNVVNALSGKVAGVQVSNSSGMAGGSSRILIRGVSSLQGNNQPLFVVDGVPFSNEEFNFEEGDEDQALFYGSTSNTGIDIDPNQIESMTVLKGAAATALYGSRAANGVILITTKSGMASKTPTFTFSSRFGLDKIRPAKTQEEYGLGTNGNYVNGET